jgi:lipopolysaccharide export system permease protein
VRFDEHAFDLSRLSAGAPTVKFAVHERYPWELLNPSPDDPLLLEQPGAFRAELNSRILSSIYPLAFLVVTFAFLGAPRTTRQSRTMSLIGAVAAIGTMRGIGFFGSASGTNSMMALVLPYVVLLATFVLTAISISRGIILEPPAFIAKAMNTLTEGLSRRAAIAQGGVR